MSQPWHNPSGSSDWRDDHREDDRLAAQRAGPVAGSDWEMCPSCLGSGVEPGDTCETCRGRGVA